jgi:hypothetical protein
MRLNTGGSGSNDGAAPTDVSSALTAPSSSNGGATWTFTFAPGTASTEASASLADGIYTATLDAAKVTDGAVAMAGSNPAVTFHRLSGDVNGSKSVNAADFNVFRAAFGKTSGQQGYDAAFDFDGNGSVNASDFNQFRSRFGKQFTY